MKKTKKKTMNVLMTKTMNIKHHYQPTGNSCGPTCLYMVMEYILNKENDLPFDVEIKYTIEDICKMCGTDWIVGTPPDRMDTGMKMLDMNYTEYIGSPRPYELLRQVLDDGNIAILRTITGGIPHWIIISDWVDNTVLEKIDDYFYVLDPSLGMIEYNEVQLEKIWKPRNYQFFEVKIPDIRLMYNHDGNGY